MIFQAFDDDWTPRLSTKGYHGLGFVNLGTLVFDPECKVNLFADMRRWSSLLDELGNQLLAPFDFEFGQAHGLTSVSAEIRNSSGKFDTTDSSSRR